MQANSNNIAPAIGTNALIALANADKPSDVQAPAIVNAKPAKPVAAKPAKRTPANPPAPTVSDPAAERTAAAAAVAEFYRSGPSFPLKAASCKTLSDYSTTNTKAPSARTGALTAVILLYANLDKNGVFTRGQCLVPATFFDPKAAPAAKLHAMPESGCLGNMHGRTITHVSGPVGGKLARDGVFKLDFAGARAELKALVAAIGEKPCAPIFAILDKLAPVKPAKPSKPAKLAA